MALQNFEELNNLSTKWFSKMGVSDAEKKKRVELSLDYCEIIIMLFMLITEEQYSRDECVRFARERIKILAEKQIGVENIAYINDFADVKSKEIVDSTFDKLDVDEDTEEEITVPELDINVPVKEYWTSEERALLVGIELSSTVNNFEELRDAIEDGKTNKVWMTEGDERVRKTHQEVHGVDIPINEFFTVGNSQMLMPGDTVNGAELKEIAGCRCYLVFH